MNEHELLDQYLDSLSRDPLVAPPDGLDPQLAALARQVAIQHRTHLPHGVEGRVWQRILQSHAQPPSHVEPSSNGSHHPHWRNEFMTVYPLQQTRPQRWSLPTISLAAAVLIIVLFGGVLLAASQWGGESEPPHAGAPAVQGSPTFVPTATIYPDRTAEFFVTPTPFPYGTVEPTIPYNPASSPMIDLPPYQDAPQVVQFGDTVEGHLAADTPRYVYALDGKAGDLVQLQVEADAAIQLDFIVVSLVTGQVNYHGQSADQTFSAYGGGGGSSDAAPQQFATSLNFAFDQFATAYVTVSSPIEAAYSLTFARLQVEQLEIGTSIVLEWNPDSWTQRVDFQGGANDIVTIQVECDYDVVMILREVEYGQPLAADDDSGVGLNPELYAIQLPKDGHYRLEIEPSLGVVVPPQAPVTIRVFAQPMLDVTDIMTEVTLTSKLPATILTAEVVEGRSYRVVTDTVVVNGNTSVRVVQDGVSLASYGLLPTARPLTESREFTAVASGMVRIYINANAGASLDVGFGDPQTVLTVRVEPVE